MHINYINVSVSDYKWGLSKINAHQTVLSPRFLSRPFAPDELAGLRDAEAMPQRWKAADLLVAGGNANPPMVFMIWSIRYNMIYMLMALSSLVLEIVFMGGLLAYQVGTTRATYLP